MASSTVKVSRKGPTSVPQPERPRFLHGTYPPEPQIARVKPGVANEREYGKTPPLSGNTGLTGLS